MSSDQNENSPEEQQALDQAEADTESGEDLPLDLAQSIASDDSDAFDSDSENTEETFLSTDSEDIYLRMDFPIEIDCYCCANCVKNVFLET